MGLFSRVSPVTPAQLPLIAPTRLSVRLSPEQPESLILYVIDPALIQGPMFGQARMLRDKILLGSSVDVLPASDSFDGCDGLHRMMLDIPLLSGSVDLIGPEFDHQWREVGARAVSGELELGITSSPGTVSAVTSAALVGATLGLPTRAEATMSQYIMRNGYLAARLLSGGSGSARPTIGDLVLDPRLFVLAGASGEAWDLVGALIARTPLPSSVLNAWETQVLLTRRHANEFLETFL